VYIELHSRHTPALVWRVRLTSQVVAAKSMLGVILLYAEWPMHPDNGQRGRPPVIASPWLLPVRCPAPVR